MKQILKVNTSGNKEYLIEISDNSFAKLNQDIYEYTHGQRRLVVMSKKVYQLYSSELNFSDDEIFILKDGEKEKNINNYYKIMQKDINLGLTRNDVIISVGGGVVGDLAGFVASTYMRGIDFIQMPTTLLAAVDASIGGKTAIDIKQGKNLVGTFYQPKAVINILSVLEELKEEIFIEGVSEIIKYGAIYDASLFPLIKDGVRKNLKEIVYKCASAKADVVSKDEKEKGL